MSKTPATYTYTRPWMYPKQEDAIFCPQRYAVIEASTKSGKTISAMCWLFEQAIKSAPNRNYWWVAPIYAQAKIAFRRLYNGIQDQAPGLLRANQQELTLTLPNGCIIWFKGGDNPDSLYGEDVYAAVLDEASRMRETAWHAVRSTLTQTRGFLRIIGNVKGRRNWAYRLARRAESGEHDMRYTKITAADAVAAGVLLQAEIDDARALLPEAVFSELYMAEANDDGGNPFGLRYIKDCTFPTAELAPGPVVAWGWDLAKKRDYTVGIGLNAAGQVAAFLRWQAPWEVTTPKIHAATGRTPALVDSTGVGDPILEALQGKAREESDPNRPASWPGRTAGGRLDLGRRPNYEGFIFTHASRQNLLLGLIVAVQQHRIGYPPGMIVSEMEEVEYAYGPTGVTYRVPEGMHDDCLFALALAWRKLQRRAPIPRVAPKLIAKRSHWRGVA